MTTQDIIKQTESFTLEQKQQLAYYFFFSTIKDEDREQYANLFHYKDKVEDTDDIYNSIVAEQFLNGYSEEDNIYNSL